MSSKTKKYTIEIDVETGEAVTGIEAVGAAVEDVKGSTDTLVSKADELTGGLVSGFGNGLKSVKSMIKGMGSLKGAIAATGIGALVVVLGSLAAWFSTTESGAKALSTAQIALDIAVKDTTDALASMITDLVGAEEGTNVFEEAVSGVWSVLKVVTPALWLFGDAIEEVFEEAVEVADKMAEAQFALVDATAKFTVENAKLTASIETNQKIIDDSTKSYSQRVAALNEQSEASKQLALNTAEQARLEEQNIQNSIALAISFDDKKALQQDLADATATRIDAETKLAVIDLDNAQKRREIDMQEIDRKQSIMDTIKQLRVDAETDERAAIEASFALAEEQLVRELELLHASGAQITEAKLLLKEQEDLALKEYDIELQAQKDADQEALDALEVQRLDKLDKIRVADNKKQADDAKKLAESKKQAALNEIDFLTQSAGAILSLGEALSNDQNKSAEQQFKVNKRRRLAGAVVDTAAAIAKTFATLGFPAGIPGAAIAAATGAAQILTIKKQTFSGGGSTSIPTVSSAGTGLTPDVGGDNSVVAPTLDTGFLNDNAIDQTSIQAYVVEQDVTNSQQANQLIEDQAAL